MANKRDRFSTTILYEGSTNKTSAYITETISQNNYIFWNLIRNYEIHNILKNYEIFVESLNDSFI